jgi:hypothetical protein
LQLVHHLLLFDEHLLEQVQVLLQVFQLHLASFGGRFVGDGSLNLINK